MLLTRREVLGVIDVSSRTLGAMLKDGRFPQPVKIGPKIHRWPESVVREWLAKKVREAGAA